MVASLGVIKLTRSSHEHYQHLFRLLVFHKSQYSFSFTPIVQSTSGKRGGGKKSKVPFRPASSYPILPDCEMASKKRVRRYHLEFFLLQRNPDSDRSLQHTRVSVS